MFDYQDSDVFGCVADVGWITGHSYVVYGPLCNGATTVLFESTPVYPNPGEIHLRVQPTGPGPSDHVQWNIDSSRTQSPVEWSPDCCGPPLLLNIITHLFSAAKHIVRTHLEQVVVK